MGLHLAHYIPFIAYLGFYVMCVVALFKEPLYGLYYVIPFLPYRTMRDHFTEYPLGDNLLSLLIVCIIVGALLKGKHLAKSKIYLTWLLFALYLYLSLWLGMMLGYGPAPLWTSDVNFVTWKDYMMLPLLLVAAGLVVEDRKAIRTVILLSAFALVFIDRASLMDSLSRSWGHFDEDKRDGGPLGFAGSNGLAAYLAQSALFFWGLLQFVKRWKVKLVGYSIIAVSLLATMYAFSRAAYIAVIAGAFVLGVLKARKLLVVLAVFLVTWQAVVPRAVTERVHMTSDANGQLEASAQGRVGLWEEAEQQFLSSPIVGEGYATYQLRPHFGNLRDTHNWYVKVIVETGLIGLFFALRLIAQVMALGWRLFRQGVDPLFQGLGLGLLLMMLASAITNFFGDRWTFIEINGILWVMVGAAARALALGEAQAPEIATSEPATTVAPRYLAYH